MPEMPEMPEMREICEHIGALDQSSLDLQPLAFLGAGAKRPIRTSDSGRKTSRRGQTVPRANCRVQTVCYADNMSENVSVRLEDRLAQRLRLQARAAGETLSDRLRRYAVEGSRRDEHPLITFRDGPTGRRAGLLGGPDLWEVAMWIDDLATEADPIETLVEETVLSRPQIEAAERYRAAYPEEIAARIDLHRSETASALRY